MEILDFQKKKTDVNMENNPNFDDNIFDHKAKNFGFTPFENIKVTLKNTSPSEKNSNHNYMLNIMSNGMAKPISFHTKFDPESKFLDMVHQIQDEMDLLEADKDSENDESNHVQTDGASKNQIDSTRPGNFKDLKISLPTEDTVQP